MNPTKLNHTPPQSTALTSFTEFYWSRLRTAPLQPTRVSDASNCNNDTTDTEVRGQSILHISLRANGLTAIQFSECTRCIGLAAPL